jgi:hypothetical protein
MATLKKIKLLTFCLMGTIGSAFAMNSQTTALEMKSQLDGENDTIQGHFGGTSNQVNRDVGDVPGNRYSGDLSFTYYKDTSRELERKFDFAALVNDQSLTMYSLQEAYVAKKGLFTSYDHVSKTGDVLKFGRQNLAWSKVDETWGLGKINNRKNFDGFLPGQEGLVGLGYEIKLNNGFFGKVFGSGLYVPETNPSLDINKSDNTISSRNPWAKPPAASTNIDGNITPIQYIVDYPSISDVIYRYSIGVSAGWENKNFAAGGYFIRKPENQISTNVEVALAQDAASVKAFVKPEFYYHDVFGGNVKYRNSDLEMYVGGMGVFPNTFPDGNQTATTYTELKTEKRREAYLGGGISKINDKYGMAFNYVARVSPFDRDRDSLAQDPRWNQAVNLFLSRNFARKYSISGDIKYDMLTTDRLVMLRAGYNVSKQLLMTFGVNMIGTPNSGKSYWSPYTNNDALLAGLRYIF